jgi:hypothetical protein
VAFRTGTGNASSNPRTLALARRRNRAAAAVADREGTASPPSDDLQTKEVGYKQKVVEGFVQPFFQRCSKGRLAAE